MKTKHHWDLSKSNLSFITAQRCALQLEEAAKVRGLSSTGIIVKDKRQVAEQGGNADARIVWENGPENWAYATDLNQLDGVWIEVDNRCTISFYDI